MSTPSVVGVVAASSAGSAMAETIMPMVVSAFAVASTAPGFWSKPAAAPAPRKRYATQRVSSS